MAAGLDSVQAGQWHWQCLQYTSLPDSQQLGGWVCCSLLTNSPLSLSSLARLLSAARPCYYSWQICSQPPSSGTCSSGWPTYSSVSARQGALGCGQHIPEPKLSSEQGPPAGPEQGERTTVTLLPFHCPFAAVVTAYFRTAEPHILLASPGDKPQHSLNCCTSVTEKCQVPVTG